jgi:hypothetical protein
MKRFAFFVAFTVLVGGVALAQDEAKPAEITGADELVKEKSKLWAETWVHPDADISRYDKLYLWQSVFQFRDVSDNQVNRTTTAMLRGNQGYFAISEDSRTRFEDLVTEVIDKELNRSKQFEIVDQVGPGTLLIRALVLDIVSNVPPNVGRQGNIHLSNMGEATFFFEIIDAETGVIQARVGDRRVIQPPSRMNQVNQAPTTRATVWNDVDMWARDQAMTLRRELDKLAKKSKK